MKEYYYLRTGRLEAIKIDIVSDLSNIHDKYNVYEDYGEALKAREKYITLAKKVYMDLAEEPLHGTTEDLANELERKLRFG